MSSSNRLLRQTDKSSVIHTDCGERESFRASFQSLVTAFSFSRSGKWSALAFKTSVQPDYWWQGPRDLPACLHQPLLNCRSKYTALIGMACSCYSEEGSSATPLMSTTVSKAGKPFLPLSVFHLDRDFSILKKRARDLKGNRTELACFGQLCFSWSKKDSSLE